MKKNAGYKKSFFFFTVLINVTTIKCGKQPQKQEGTVYFIQYAGSEDFDNEESFSNEWKHCFEYPLSRTFDSHIFVSCHIVYHIYVYHIFVSCIFVLRIRYEDKCPKCKQNATIKNYFKNWPRFLFVIASNSHVFFRNALKYDFTVGSRYFISL